MFTRFIEQEIDYTRREIQSLSQRFWEYEGWVSGVISERGADNVCKYLKDEFPDYTLSVEQISDHDDWVSVKATKTEGQY